MAVSEVTCSAAGSDSTPDSRFHPSNAVQRAREMRQLLAALSDLTQNQFEQTRIVLGGDRNFVSAADQKLSTATESWHPGAAVISAWQRLLTEIGGVQYLHINSASYHWLGSKYAHESYPSEVHAKHSALKYTSPYREALFTTLTFDPKNRKIIVERKAK